MKISEALLWARSELNHIKEGNTDALFLLSAATQKEKAMLMAFDEEELDHIALQSFKDFIIQRKKHKPVSQILGNQPFWKWDFKVSGDVLTPRFDSECLVEAVLDDFSSCDNIHKIADFGTGSGCLLLSVLSEFPKAKGYGLDISDKALNMAQQNEIELQQQGAIFTKPIWVKGSWEALKDYGPFDIILANPPYIGIKEEKDLSIDVKKYEPNCALFAENEGLAAYEALFPLFKQILTKKGRAYVEHGYKQQDILVNLAEAEGLKVVRRLFDLAQNPRGLVLSL